MFINHWPSRNNIRFILTRPRLKSHLLCTTLLCCYIDVKYSHYTWSCKPWHVTKWNIIFKKMILKLLYTLSRIIQMWPFNAPHESYCSRNELCIIGVLAKGTLWNPEQLKLLPWLLLTLHKFFCKALFLKATIYNSLNMENLRCCPPWGFTPAGQWLWSWKLLCLLPKEKRKYQNSHELIHLQLDLYWKCANAIVAQSLWNMGLFVCFVCWDTVLLCSLAVLELALYTRFALK